MPALKQPKRWKNKVRVWLRPVFERVNRFAIKARLVPEYGGDNVFLHHVPPGHFYSPVPGDADVLRREPPQAVPADINLNPEGQRQLLEQLSQYYRELPFAETRREGMRYSFDNIFYCHSDAIYLYGMMRHFRPKRLVEVGSGYSSAVALDTSEQFLSGAVEFVFIEPFPDRLRLVLKPSDAGRCRLFEKPVQEVPLEMFDALEENDILFIDSSHVCKVGSDVNHLLFHVLPRLRAGVLVHIHDIFYPFEYPKEWFQEGRAWNEIYAVRAFLQNNEAYRILLFASYAGEHFRSVLEERMPLCLKNTGSSLWLRKVK